MHPRRAGRRTREILRNSGDSGKPAAQAKRGRTERGADRADRAGSVLADRGGAAGRENLLWQWMDCRLSTRYRIKQPGTKQNMLYLPLYFD